jgi:type II secretory ATPase GspE/PulE/Tfp pilus assembly ATPase PilB-like protein/CheY-like chemotaxis protein
MYQPENVIEQLIEGMGSSTQITQVNDDQLEDLNLSAQHASDRPIVRLVDLILSQGIDGSASDIHIEPEQNGVAVRYRIDGVLRQAMTLPRGVGLPAISRIKIMSGMDIADRLRPQDGRSRVAVNGVAVDLRVSTLPAAVGEKVVIRILDSSKTVLSLESLGLAAQESAAIRGLLDNRDGVILVTGPTGSGKTTTLYSAIRHVQSEGVNIVTVEDPVEYRMQGIVQVQVHQKARLTFASALRSILRQDPDVVLVGEIRDRETAQIAVQASLTGHLVLSTLHTNDAPNAVTRLVDVGVESYKIGSALRGVVAQRLMRRLCPACKESWVEDVPTKLKRWIPNGTPLYRAVGCDECAMTGYRGRFAIVEVLQVTPEVERRIAANETVDRIAEAARRGGMRTLWESGLEHILDGESTIDELLRVVDVPIEDDKGVDDDEGVEDLASPKSNGHHHPEESNGRTALGDRLVAQSPMYDRSVHVELDFELLEPRPTDDQSSHRVLLVDDEEPFRKVVKDLLGREGFQVLEARDGAEALEQVDRHAPDIIVLDLNLPGLDGYGVLSGLRSRPATSDIPVVVLSARGDEENEVRVFELGANDFLSKPFRYRALAARLRALMRVRQSALS